MKANECSKLSSWFKTNLDSRAITANAFIACLYAVVTIICGPLSYSFSQFRFSEALNLLVFFNPTYTIGLTLGCLLANLMKIRLKYKDFLQTLGYLTKNV